MFDIGWGELVLIGLVALIVIGPKELPTVMRTAGQWMGRVKRMAAEFQGQFQEALREAELSDLKSQADELKSSFSEFSNFDPLAEKPKEAISEPWDNPAEAAPEAVEPPVEPEALPAPAGEHTAATVSEPSPPAKVEVSPTEPLSVAEELKPAEALPSNPAGGRV